MITMLVPNWQNFLFVSENNYNLSILFNSGEMKKLVKMVQVSPEVGKVLMNFILEAMKDPSKVSINHDL